MAGRECADIVFCIDASDSMRPCIDSVKSSINRLVGALTADKQRAWDIRLDFLAHATGNNIFRYQTVKCSPSSIIDELYLANSSPSARCFTTDIEEFKKALTSVETVGDEASLVALDTVVDFPWRSASACHRVVILLTDEPVETGDFVKEQEDKTTQLIEKLHTRKILLFVVAPESAIFSQLARANKCVYKPITIENDGMRSVEFSKLMDAIGRSVSVSQYATTSTTDRPLPLFGQEKWTVTSGSLGGDRGAR